MQTAQLLAKSVRDYLRDFRQLTLSDLNELLSYFQAPTDYCLSGSLTLRFSSKVLREQDKYWITETETIVFAAAGYNIRIHQREDFYGEGYSTNDDRIDKHMSYEELLSASSESFSRLIEIMEENAGHLTVTTQRFTVIKRRISSRPN